MVITREVLALNHTVCYFHILFPYLKRYSNILFVLPLHG